MADLHIAVFSADPAHARTSGEWLAEVPDWVVRGLAPVSVAATCDPELADLVVLGGQAGDASGGARGGTDSPADAGSPAEVWRAQLTKQRLHIMVERRLAGGRPTLLWGPASYVLFTGTEAFAEDDADDPVLAQWPAVLEPLPEVQWTVDLDGERVELHTSPELGCRRWLFEDQANPYFAPPVVWWAVSDHERIVFAVHNGPLLCTWAQLPGEAEAAAWALRTVLSDKLIHAVDGS